ncbi:Uncharacterised protein [Mycobacteroides abscessus subsp. abscessus]|nr:Uncharacterised protein [Mycobacteroides abscessus subsp. abscessus]
MRVAAWAKGSVRASSPAYSKDSVSMARCSPTRWTGPTSSPVWRR